MRRVLTLATRVFLYVAAQFNFLLQIQARDLFPNLLLSLATPERRVTGVATFHIDDWQLSLQQLLALLLVQFIII